MVNIWKVTLTLPRFIRMFIKSSRMAKKIIKDPNVVTEEYRYYWLQKRAKYFLWLNNINVIPYEMPNWLDKGCLLVANHQSNFDPVILFALNNFEKTAPCAFIAKKELSDSKTTYKFLSLIDVLFLDRTNPRQALTIIDEANELVRVPRTMVVFPEGTRSHSEKMGEFHAGVFKIAQRAHVPIIPVSIIDSYLLKEKKSYRKKYVKIVFNKPIKPDTFMSRPTEAISNIVKTSIQKGIEKYKDNNSVNDYKKYKKSLKVKNNNL